MPIHYQHIIMMKLKLVCVLIFLFFIEGSISYGAFKATVAQDGTGDYIRINDAIAAAPMQSTTRYYIHVKPGVYYEYVNVWENKTNIALIGDDASTTKITGNRSAATHYSSVGSATMNVFGSGFIGQSLTIENSAPPPNSGQAVALNNQANHSIFYKCIFLGYQDTLLANENLQFYKNCDIYGSVDFIWGFAKAVFQDCRLYVRRIALNNVITAQGKDNPTMESGFSFQNCSVTIAPEISANRSDVKIYLGRPWMKYATVVFMQSCLDNIVAREGWMPMSNNTNFFFAEYNNRGLGANTNGRMPGHKVFKNAAYALPYTVSRFIDGDSWIPETGIPYRRGLNR